MSVPKKKRTKSSVGRRRSHHSLKPLTLSICAQCGHEVKPHSACSFCGTYKDREVVEIKNKNKKEEKK